MDKALKEELKLIVPPERIRNRFIDLVSFASDAGFYYLLPKAVVQPVSEKEIIDLFKFSRQHRIPLVFRTGGTSLSGQSITDGILVDLSQFWNKIRIEEDGLMVRVQPGITGAMVNAYLKKHRRKIGPDPSSISAAMMGGILSNNASGMCCGVSMNSYHTTKYIRFVLPGGQTFTTEDPGDYGRFEKECSKLFGELQEIRAQIHLNTSLFDKIRHKYLTKNTVGYSLNAFVDHEHPLDILAHLLIGAEGTLAFISEAVLETVPDYPFKSTALLYFPTIYDACQAIVPLTNAGAMMVELMDRASLHAVENMKGMPAVVKTLPESAAALLIEFQEDSLEKLEERVLHFLASSSQITLINQPVFTTDPAEQDFLWKVRKGLFPAVGAVRASGTTVILEDVAFPVEKLGDAILELQELFRIYGYHNAIIFGHAKDGNIHFVVTQSLNTDEEVNRYDRFMREVVTLVVEKYDGSLKAEHGTGRNMAPFVETEWGVDAYQIIKRIKKAVDPEGLLNPGVIINDDAEAHIKNLKELPSVEEEVDRCIECGYCEHKCPSRDITTTPRRRIVIRRVLKSMELAGNKTDYEHLLREFQYDVLDTCAVDGLCATACPVDINTGDLVKRLRRENHSPFANRVALLVAKNFGLTERAVRGVLKIGVSFNNVFGRNTMKSFTRILRRVFPEIPLWSDQLAYPPDLSALEVATAKTHNSNIGDLEAGVVYFPSCISRTLGSYEGKMKNLMETFLSICGKSGIPVTVLKDAVGSCCSQIYGSKGLKDAYRFTANRIVDQLWENSHGGKMPVVIDVSSCAYTLHHIRPVLDEVHRLKYDQIKILDAVEFIHDQVLPRVSAKSKRKDIVLHPVCSLQKMKTEAKFTAIARCFAEH
ncbi:MAG TPA: FAD-binding and (Fe-S)-binding domain-containing protein, partial [Chitinophagaceae bacterium]|nr:FAD-binding and (Fe-S)-binding domain-containing protein [Chitinophagaceae bacterium]